MSSPAPAAASSQPLTEDSSPSAVAARAAFIAATQQSVRAGAAALADLGADSTDWKQIDETDGVKAFVKEGTGSERSVFKGVGVLKAPLAVCMELVMDTSKKSAYDSIFEGCTVLEDLTDHIKVEHQKYWAPFPVSKRDFCIMLHKARLSDGTICLFGRSTEHALCPEGNKHIRAVVIIGGWLLKSVPMSDGTPSNSTLATFVACTDLRGDLPAFVKTQLDRKQPQQLNTVKPMLAKRVDELAKLKLKDAAEHARQMEKLAALIDVLPVYSSEDIAQAKKEQQ